MIPDIELRGVAAAYGRHRVLEGVDVTVRRGEVIGVIGPNGAGKTTLLRVMSGALPPQSGGVFLEGRDARDLPCRERAGILAVVPQETGISFPFTTLEVALMGRYPHARNRFFDAPADLEAARAALGESGVLDLSHRTIDRLSGGERQRVLIARALAQRPRILLLDEPMAHLDLQHQIQVAHLLRRLNRHRTTVVLVAHDLNLASELSDRVLLLAGGRVAAFGPPKEVIRQPIIEQVYGCPVSVQTDRHTGRPLVLPRWQSEHLDESPETAVR